MKDKTNNVAPGRVLNRLAATDRGLLAVSIGSPLVSGALLLVQASLLAGVLGDAIVDGAKVEALWASVALILAVIVARAVLGIVGETAAAAQSERVKQRLRSDMFADIILASPTTTAAKSSGALAGTLIDQVEAIDGYVVRYLPAMVQATFLPLAFAAVIFPIDWVVTLIFLGTAPVIPVFMALVGWGAEAASRAQATALNRLGGRFADRLRGLTTLSLFGEAERETARVRNASDELRMRTMRVMRIAFLSSAVLEFFAALGVAGVALYVGLTFLDLVSLRATELTLAAGMFCLLMAPEVYNPLRLLAAHYHDRANAKAAVAEIEAQLGQMPQTAPAAAAQPAGEAAGPLALRLAGVAVATPDGRPVLSDVDLKVAPGERVAILGASGIGKSTLLEAIAGLRTFEGAISIGDLPLPEIAEPLLRQRVAMLGQRPRIFAGTIEGNIRLGRNGACHAALRRAAHLAHVADFADELPDALHTRIGEDGLGLSGGEIQRVALARIYLRDPGLLLLDEPTAHLDAATEAALLDDLGQFAKGRTLLVATHSHAVAARMDRVFRVANGRLLPAPKPVLVSKAGAA